MVMSQHLIYKSMPYLIIIAGFLFVLYIESDVLHAAVFVLFSTAFLLLWMRYSSRVERENIKHTSLNSRDDSRLRNSKSYVHRSSGDRRIINARSPFPIFDRSGLSVSTERRLDERRHIIL